MDKKDFADFNDLFLGLDLAAAPSVSDAEGRELVMLAYHLRGELDAPADYGRPEWRDLVEGERSLDEVMHRGDDRVAYWVERLDDDLGREDLLQQMLHEARQGNPGLNTDPTNVDFRVEVSQRLLEKLESGAIDPEDPASLIEARNAVLAEAARAAGEAYKVEEVPDEPDVSWWGIEDDADGLASALANPDLSSLAEDVAWFTLVGDVDQRLDLSLIDQGREAGDAVRLGFDDNQVHIAEGHKLTLTALQVERASEGITGAGDLTVDAKDVPQDGQWALTWNIDLQDQENGGEYGELRVDFASNSNALVELSEQSTLKAAELHVRDGELDLSSIEDENLSVTSVTVESGLTLTESPQVKQVTAG